MGRSRGGDDRNKKNLQAILARLSRGSRANSIAREQTLDDAKKGIGAASHTAEKQTTISENKNYASPSLGVTPPTSWVDRLSREGHIGISQMNKEALIGVAEVKDAFEKYLPPRYEPEQAKEQERWQDRVRGRGDEG